MIGNLSTNGSQVASWQHVAKSCAYASSSSVYGLNELIPFSEKHRVDSQASLYGATKKANENLAHVYHHLHGLKLTGLRFFTVYGPGGRPDMAPFKFVDRVSRGVEIQQFGDGSTSRDYTYVDDIVDGVVRPQRFSHHMEGNAEDSYSLDFDWSAQEVTYRNEEGDSKTMPLGERVVQTEMALKFFQPKLQARRFYLDA